MYVTYLTYKSCFCSSFIFTIFIYQWTISVKLSHISSNNEWNISNFHVSFVCHVILPGPPCPRGLSDLSVLRAASAAWRNRRDLDPCPVDQGPRGSHRGPMQWTMAMTNWWRLEVPTRGTIGSDIFRYVWPMFQAFFCYVAWTNGLTNGSSVPSV